MRNRTVLAVLGLSLLTGLPPLAADSMIRHGIDVFTTAGDGKTYYDFAYNPIPAGFFCKGSKAFTARVALKGMPLVIEVPGQLWGADTIIERLDDAVFDATGTAVTRIQFRALSLVSIAPVKTACGAFHVYVSLGGKQRVTKMNIRRTQEDGGSFAAPLGVDARMTFIPVKPRNDKGSRKLELTGSFTFPASPRPWSLTGGAMAKRVSSVVVDTNGDLIPDTRLPGTSSFLPGEAPELLTTDKGLIGACPCEPTCHSTTGKMHCTTPTSECYPVICPN